MAFQQEQEQVQCWKLGDHLNLPGHSLADMQVTVLKEEAEDLFPQLRSGKVFDVYENSTA